MILKKSVLLVLVLVLLPVSAVFASGSQEAQVDSRYKIGITIREFDDKWVSYMVDAMSAAADEVKDEAFVNIVDAKSDVARQLSQIENFIAQKYDVIVVNPVDTDATEAYTRIAKEAGVPIMSVNLEFKNQSEATSYVGSKSITAGIMQMEALGELMGGKGNIAIMIGQPAHEAAIARTAGVKQVIAEKYPDIKVIAEQAGNWQRTEGLDIMENWLQTDMKIDAVAANNDEMAIGALMAIENAGKLGEIYVAGVDATPDALEMMKAGKLDITVFQSAQGQGRGAVEIALEIARGNKVEPINWIPYELVLPSQVDEYIAKWK